MKNTLRTPYFLTLLASLGLVLAPVGCGGKGDDESSDDETTGDGDGDQTGDGDGDDMTGDGDGDETGDGDGDATGDGDGDETGDGDGDCVGEGENGTNCTSNCECASGNCYVVPLVGGQCGECDNVEGDMDCAEITGGGCTPPNPFGSDGSTCNMGELGGGCQTSEVCEDGLVCSTVLDLLSGVIQINTCSNCETDADCGGDDICAPVVNVEEFSGINDCVAPGSMLQDSYCNLGDNGDAACEGVCSIVDIMGIAQIGACGECMTDDDCDGGTCVAGDFDLGGGTLSGSTCQ
ncbi:MAG: hypothetical protein R6X02_01965 [Enhygromyxa sp.]